jgi:phage terminase small subunit
MALTDKQQRFIQEYLKDCNATQAAIRAGYSEDSAYEIGSKNLRKVEIEVALTEAKKQLAEAAQVEAEWVVKNLKSIAMRCMQVEPVIDNKGNHLLVKNDDGNLVPAYTFNAQGAVQSLKTINEMCGFEASKKLDVNVKQSLADIIGNINAQR